MANVDWRRVAVGWVLLMIAGWSAGCVATTTFGPEQVVRAAREVPERFLVGDWADATVRQEPRPGGGCRSPMVDPRDGTQLRMVRSGIGQADYEAPDGRYGVAEGELLRIECATGRAVGVVRR